MIKQIHVSECDSTQDVLKEQLNNLTTEALLLVSCENQNSGRGRGENKWTSLAGTLCLSINIRPHEVFSFTAIEMAVIVADFFESKGKALKLKWPNDLWNEEQKKCGGILVQGTQNNLLAGIGLNLFSDDGAFGGVFPAPFELSKEKWARELGEFIHRNRIDDARELNKRWLMKCGHLNEMVRITEGNEAIEGIFQGLGDYGEALVCCNGQTRKIYNGSLRLSQG